MHILKSYAWLLGDVALFVWVIYELIALGPRKSKPPPPEHDDDHN